MNNSFGEEISFFCTVGKGLEEFCALELNQLGNVNIVLVTVGKVFFTCRHNVYSLLSLKTVERLFITVLHIKQFLVEDTKKVELSKLKNFLDNENIQWKHCFSLWVKFKNYQSFDYSDSDLIENDNCYKVPDTLNLHNKNCKSCYQEVLDIVTFRVNCKLSGFMRQQFSNNKLSAIIAQSVVKFENWKIALRSPQLEIFVRFCNSFITIGFPVSSQPLSFRCYLKHIALRSTICYSMLLAAGNIKYGSVILDPMCGSGTLAVEAAVNYSDISVFAADIDSSQLIKTIENVCIAYVNHKVSVIKSDAAHLPFKEGVFDVIVCDLPFGCKHSTEEDVKKLIPEVLFEMNRVLYVNGTVVLLISCKLKEYLNKCVEELNNKLNVKLPKISDDSGSNIVCDTKTKMPTIWICREQSFVQLGKLEACICIFQKRSIGISRLNH